jgi:hypothetical protein
MNKTEIDNHTRVSAAQTRKGELLDVAVMEGSSEYQSIMAQIQQDLKGNRWAQV